jgi:hypothetical protein
MAVTLRVEGMEELLASIRAEVANLLREFATREAGPVRERLRQIAEIFEVSDGRAS